MTRFPSPPMIDGVPVPYSATFEELESSLALPGPKTWAAFIALGHVPTMDALELLVGYSRSDDWRYRRSAIEALAIHPLGRIAGGVVQAALHDTSAFVVRTACEVCAHLQLVPCHAELFELLRARAAATRMAALAALETPWQPEDMERVLNIAGHDVCEDVRRRASWTLRTNATADNWSSLYETWKVHALPRHRVWACELAMQYGSAEDARLMADLCALAGDPDGHVRKRARAALATLRAPSPGDAQK